MKKANVGAVDKALRIVVGAGLVGWAAIGGPIWAWIGVLPLATGLMGYCALYSLLGINTCQLNKK